MSPFKPSEDTTPHMIFKQLKTGLTTWDLLSINQIYMMFQYYPFLFPKNFPYNEEKDKDE